MDRRTLGFIGSGVLGFGVFLPIVSMPLLGSINYFNNGSGDGTIVLVLAVVSAVLVHLGRFRWLFLTAGLSAAISLITVYRFMNLRSAIEARTGAAMPDNPLAARFASALAGTVQLQWGWFVIFAGIGCLLYVAWRDSAGTPPADL
jgi:hypothetical protein